ncbi:MAG TPA: recombinase family protein [Trueperaceae bacterium]
MPGRYIVYTRNSTVDQRDNTSPAVQTDQCRRYADSQGWEEAAEPVYDNISGTTSERPGLTQIREAIEARDVDVVLFSTVDRIARERKALEAILEDIFKRGGTVAVADMRSEFKSLEDFLDETIFYNAFAEHERRKTLRRSADATAAILQKGGWVVKTIFGYQLEPKLIDGIKVKMPGILDHQAEAVKLIYRLTAAGQPYYQITKRLNADGFEPRTRTGEGWAASTVNRILDHGMMYAGEPFERRIHVRGKPHVVTYKYPAILTREQVQAALEVRVLGRARDPSPFRKLIRCSGCGAYVGPSSVKETNGRRQHILSCASYRRLSTYKYLRRPTRFSVCKYSVSDGKIRDAVLEWLERTVFYEEDGDFENRLRNELIALVLRDTRATSQLDQLEEQLSLLVEEQDKIARNFASLEPDQFESVLSVLNDRLTRLDQQRSELEQEIGEVQAKQRTGRAALDRLGVEPVELQVDPKLEEEPDYNALVEDGIVSRAEEHVEGLMGRLETLKESLKGDDWKSVNAIMHELGLGIFVDHRIKNREERWASIHVDFDPAKFTMGTDCGWPRGGSGQGR